ncbi:MAG TPA: alpha-hydroxy acid oxidase [Stellaceae bacterium]
MNAASRLKRIHSIADFRDAARRVLPRMVFDYVDGGSGTESTLRENAAALERIRLVSSAPADVSTRSLAISLFGKEYPMPLIVAPLGLASSFWVKGELALARGAARHGIPWVLSNNASVTLTEAMAAGAGPKWFQLYVPPNRAATKEWTRLAKQAGFEALQITVDTAVPSRRLRDLRHGFSMPFAWTASKLFDVATRPDWTMRIGPHGIPRPKLMFAVPWGAEGAAPDMRTRLSPALSWDLIRWLRDEWQGPLMVKGLADPHQASVALAAGIDAIVISNHGGRQLDGAVATIDLLPEFVAEVGGKLPILIDSGFRTGMDVVKALALGATAVQVGRAAAYAVATAGEAGVDHALTILRGELDTTMALMGVTRIADLNPSLIRRTGGAR